MWEELEPKPFGQKPFEAVPVPSAALPRDLPQRIPDLFTCQHP